MGQYLCFLLVGGGVGCCGLGCTVLKLGCSYTRSGVGIGGLIILKSFFIVIELGCSFEPIIMTRKNAGERRAKDKVWTLYHMQVIPTVESTA